MVANSSTSRQVSLSCCNDSPRSRASALSKPRCVPMVARIVPNMCPPFDAHTSIERLGRMPARSSRPVAGQPCPICSSISGEIDALQPASAIIASSSSASALQWTKVIVGPSIPRSASAAIGRPRPHSPSPAWQLMRMPSSSASRQSCSVTSSVANWFPRGARQSVTSWSSDEKYWSRRRRTSSS